MSRGRKIKISRRARLNLLCGLGVGSCFSGTAGLPCTKDSDCDGMACVEQVCGGSSNATYESGGIPTSASSNAGDTSGTETSAGMSAGSTHGPDVTGGNDAGDTIDSTGEPQPEFPEAAILHLAFSQVKQFDFSWSPASKATYYQLYERLPGGGGYTEFGDNVAGGSVSVTMPLHLRLGASYIVSACNGQGCTDSRPLDVADSMAEAVGYFKASNNDPGDEFGSRVVMSGDGNTLAVAAVYEQSFTKGINGDQAENSAPAAGAVYVFTRTADSWSQQAYIKASNTGDGDLFGFSLSLSVNGDILAVGAPQEDSAGAPTDNSAVDAGAIYVFTRAGNTWAQQEYIKASNTEAGDWFGRGVALSADGSTLAVAANGEDGAGGNEADNSAENAGAAYVFTRNANTWTQQAYLKASNAEFWDLFGSSVALSADGNTLAVGANSEDSGAGQGDNSASQAGAVYMFTRTANAWTQEAYLKASNSGSDQLLGRSVALSADGNTLAVGAHLEDSAAIGINGEQDNMSAADSGAAYVFTRSGKAWSQQAYVKPSNTFQGSNFGESVSISADGNIIAVGAKDEDSMSLGVGGEQINNLSSGAGAAYVFTRAANIWSQQAYVKAPNTDADDSFGASVALSGDGNVLAIGAPNEASAAVDIGGNQANNSAPESGAVYVY